VEPKNAKKWLRVVAGVIVREDAKVLIARRDGNSRIPFLWEYPGGKVEPGESLRDCLKRELHEELNVEVCVGEWIGTVVHPYSFGVVELAAFFAFLRHGQPECLEHLELKWVEVDELSGHEFPPADQPINRALASQSGMALFREWCKNGAKNCGKMNTEVFQPEVPVLGGKK